MHRSSFHFHKALFTHPTYSSDGLFSVFMMSTRLMSYSISLSDIVDIIVNVAVSFSHCFFLLLSRSDYVLLCILP